MGTDPLDKFCKVLLKHHQPARTYAYMIVGITSGVSPRPLVGIVIVNMANLQLKPAKLTLFYS
jgi:hypothetical protein